MATSVTIGALAGALAKAQAKIVGAKKDAQNVFFKASYADLASVWDAIRDPLSSCGLAVVQTTRIDGESTVLITTLAHSSGEWISGEYPVVPIKRDPQGYGSAVTYARRYALQSIVGVAGIDDDGEAAMGRKPEPVSNVDIGRQSIVAVDRILACKSLADLQEFARDIRSAPEEVKEATREAYAKRKAALSKAVQREPGEDSEESGPCTACGGMREHKEGCPDA